MNIDEIYGPGWELLDWTVFDETRTWINCADCGEKMLVADTVRIVYPKDIFPTRKVDNPANLCAPLCESCVDSWFGPFDL